MRLIYPSLPRLVKQRYGTELRSRTLASIKPEFSQALSSLLEEIRASDDAKILRAAVADDFRRPRPGGRSDPKIRTRPPRQDKVCPLCKQAASSNTNHFLNQCTFLPDNDRCFMVKARQIVGILDDEEDTTYDLDPDPPCHETTLPTPEVVAYRVQTRQSPYVDVFHGHRVVRITIDSEATGNMIRHSTAKRLGCPVISSAQSIQQADGSSQLQVVGEIWTSLPPENTDFTIEGLVVEYLEVAVLAGTPFMEANDVAVLAQPGIVSSVVRAIRIPNLSTEPRTLKRHKHFCQVTPVFEPKEEPPTSQPPTQHPLPPSHASHSASVQVDPDRILPEAVRANFQSLLSECDSVFDPQFPGYNGSAGPYQAKVNMGPVEPPQQKGRLP